jgi:hypothetical protein
LLHIILFSYAIVMFKPVFPYVEDFIGHVLFYKKHMATVHYENGKYHVHAEVTKNAKEDNSNKNTPSSKKENTSTDHIVILNKVSVTITTITSHKYSLLKNNNLLAGNLSYNYPPPRI